MPGLSLRLGLYVLVSVLVLFACAILAYGEDKRIPFGDLTARHFCRDWCFR